MCLRANQLRTSGFPDISGMCRRPPAISSGRSRSRHSLSCSRAAVIHRQEEMGPHAAHGNME
eukprot:7409045-Pyramimonas_sp.AAC.1